MYLNGAGDWTTALGEGHSRAQHSHSTPVKLFITARVPEGGCKYANALFDGGGPGELEERRCLTESLSEGEQRWCIM